MHTKNPLKQQLQRFFLTAVMGYVSEFARKQLLLFSPVTLLFLNIRHISMSNVKGGDPLFPNTNSECRQQTRTHIHTHTQTDVNTQVKTHYMRNFRTAKSDVHRLCAEMLLVSVWSS